MDAKSLGGGSSRVAHTAGRCQKPSLFKSGDILSITLHLEEVQDMVSGNIELHREGIV